MPRLLALVAAVAAVAFGSPASADPSDLLVRASQAARQANYEGVVVFRDERTLEVLRLVHRTKDGAVQERLTSLTGAPRDVLRQGDQLSCAVGERVDRTGGLPQSLFPEITAASLAKATRVYEFRDLGESRIAGRTCRTVAMVPRDDYRYGYEICADAATAVPLKISLLDRRGRTVEQLMFTHVSFPTKVADAAFEAPRAAVAVAVPTAATTAKAPGWQLSQLPPGFRIIMTGQAPAADGAGMVDHVLLSDGLSAVSVFGAMLPGKSSPLQGSSRIGAVNAYGRQVGDLHVTVVGEVPEGTVRMIGEGLKTASASAPAP